ncbi:hypothetical protein FisN_29Lh051 [Fistulifera solaris]|uniref:Uncharacterized protein n=1 Tax=Fistulifera solaris TaxID=1519565 RepID=A0A1Z5JLF2_FISSO|nr:hypothetical protein FisN_29Lh051 [Fistulifera solaris]|eukprot:GAX14843.1 hypothetical protein FisN_29Lh051 [Fistulifera solaris]
MTDGWDDDDDIHLDDDSNVNGWGDDDFFFQEEEEEVNAASPIQDNQPTKNNDGWGDDLDNLDEMEEDPVSDYSLKHKIKQHWEQLEHLKASLNAILQSEYNTPDKAQELIHYYSQRPALRDYTIHKELPRMQYTLIKEDGDVVEDLEEMAALLQHDPTLISHCANQSLLADLLQVCTGPDLLIRPQFLASAVADHVQFRLDLAAAVVQVFATLTVSLPTEQGRWSLATVQVQVVFGCHAQQPFVEYHIRSIQRNSTTNELEACVRFLSSHMEDLQDHSVAPEQPPSGNHFRDLFLQQSQAVWAQSATGLRSAWKDMDSVTGLSQKLPRFLPNDVLLEATAESEQQQQVQQVQRPSSILGGFVRTGLTKLAQSVALPDEDPSLYTDVMMLPPVPIPPPNSSNSLHRLTEGSQHARQTSFSGSNPLDRLTHGSQHARQASLGSNLLDRLTTQVISNQVSSQVRVHPLDRLTQGQPNANFVASNPSSNVRANPLDRLTQGKQDFDSASSGAPINPLDRRTKSHQDTRPISASAHPLDRLTQLQSQQFPSYLSTVATNPLDRLTPMHSKPFAESTATASSVLRNDDVMDRQNDHEDEDVVEDGWDDVDDLDLEDDELDKNPATVTRGTPLADKLPPGYKYNPEDDIIPTRRRWIDPDPGIRIPRPVR